MPRKFIKSLNYARAGAKHTLQTQRNIWIHFALGLLVLTAAAWLGVSLIEFAVLTLAALVVIVTEIINTAIEELVNILSPEHRREAALAKNVAAAAVMAASLGAVVVGVLILYPQVVFRCTN